MNRCEKPLSMFMGASIIKRATPGCVNPPIVTIIEDMEKFASPHTKQKGSHQSMRYLLSPSLKHTHTHTHTQCSPWFAHTL